MTGSGQLSNQTWEFSFVTNRWRRLADGPPARFDLNMAASLDKAWAYGGFNDPMGRGPLGDLWEFDLQTNAWRLLPGGPTLPAPRASAPLAYDYDSHKLYVFGGQDGNPGARRDTWSYDLTTARWAMVSPAGEVPDALTHQAYDFDPALRRLLAVGGDRNDGNYVSSMWALSLDPLVFVRVTAALELPRRAHGVVVRDGFGRLILFGGIGREGMLGDTWIFGSAGK
jgi:hypothetical protein